MAVYKDEYNSGKWRYRKQVSNPRTKEKKTLSKRGFTSKKEAAMAESIAISDFLNLSTFSTLPFDYVIKDYIEYKEKRLTSRSMQKITSVVNKYILPEVIDFDMRIFSPLQARDFYDNLINKDCSNNLKNYIIDQLKAIFKYGSKMYHLDNNPTQSAYVA